MSIHLESLGLGCATQLAGVWNTPTRKLVAKIAGSRCTELPTSKSMSQGSKFEAWPHCLGESQSQGSKVEMRSHCRELSSESQQQDWDLTSIRQGDSPHLIQIFNDKDDIEPTKWVSDYAISYWRLTLTTPARTWEWRWDGWELFEFSIYRSVRGVAAGLS